jgi:hypothetical protein
MLDVMYKTQYLHKPATYDYDQREVELIMVYLILASLWRAVIIALLELVDSAKYLWPTTTLGRYPEKSERRRKGGYILERAAAIYIVQTSFLLKINLQGFSTSSLHMVAGCHSKTKIRNKKRYGID